MKSKMTSVQNNFGFAFFIGYLFLISFDLSINYSVSGTIYQENETLFSSLVQYVKKEGLQFQSPQELKQLRIDPRMIDSTYMQFAKLEEKHLQTQPDSEIDQHIETLKKYDIPTTNVITDLECVFSQGLPNPSNLKNSEKEIRSDFPFRCEEKGFFLSVIFGHPNKVPASKCTQNDSTENNSTFLPCFAVRADEYTSYSEFSFRLFVIKDPVKGWVVVRKKLLGGAYS